MIAAGPAAAGDSRGWIAGGHIGNACERELIARALRPPPRSRSWVGMGCRPPQRLRCDRKIASAASFGKCGTPSGALTGQKHHPAAW